MKIAFKIAALVVFFVAPSHCFAEWGISPVGKERAKELGIEVRSERVGPNNIQIEIKFKTKGALKRFAEGTSSSDPSRVELHIGMEDNPAVIAPLREDRSTPGHIVVRFTADRSQLDKLSLRVKVAQGLGGAIYQLRIQDFIRSEPDAVSETKADVPIDLHGDWRLLLPAGFEYRVKLVRADFNRYRLETEGLNFDGLYAVAGDRLAGVASDDADKSDRRSFTWKIRSRYMLSLIEQPVRFGADYSGAVLFRLSPAGLGRGRLTERN